MVTHIRNSYSALNFHEFFLDRTRVNFASFCSKNDQQLLLSKPHSLLAKKNVYLYIYGIYVERMYYSSRFSITWHIVQYVELSRQLYKSISEAVVQNESWMNENYDSTSRNLFVVSVQNERTQRTYFAVTIRNMLLSTFKNIWQLIDTFEMDYAQKSHTLLLNEKLSGESNLRTKLISIFFRI